MQRPASFGDAVSQLDRPTYENLRRALQLGRWPDGRMLTAEHREICLEAVVGWEAAHLPEEQRSGFIERKQCASEVEDRIRIITDE